jgi:hypothetical protein
MNDGQGYIRFEFNPSVLPSASIQGIQGRTEMDENVFRYEGRYGVVYPTHQLQTYYPDRDSSQ